jgi:hypothetical protein
MVAQSLSSLLQRASIDDHEEVLQACTNSLSKNKSDLNAHHIKIIALLKLDRYEDALRVFETGGDDLKRRASFEYAYALYKIGKLNESMTVLSQSERSRGVNHLDAQVVCFLESRALGYMEHWTIANCLLLNRATGLSSSAVLPISTNNCPKIRRRTAMKIMT